LSLQIMVTMEACAQLLLAEQVQNPKAFGVPAGHLPAGQDP